MTDKKYEDLIKEHVEWMKLAQSTKEARLKAQFESLQKVSKEHFHIPESLKKEVEKVKQEIAAKRTAQEIRKQVEEGFQQQKALFERNLKFKLGDRVLILPDSAALVNIVSPLCWFAGSPGNVIRTEINMMTGISIGIKLDSGKEVQSFYPNLELILMDYNMELIYGKS